MIRAAKQRVIQSTAVQRQPTADSSQYKIDNGFFLGFRYKDGDGEQLQTANPEVVSDVPARLLPKDLLSNSA